MDQDRGFTGREFDAETGLYYYRARHYDPALGRFLQSDPIGFAAGDLNLYAYTWNDPQNWTDPSGLASTSEKTTLNSRIVGLAGKVVGPAGRAVAGGVIRDYARGTIAAGVECASNKVGTLLSSYGAALAEGASIGDAVATKVGECVMGAIAPVPPCGCKGRGQNSFAEGTEVLTPEGMVAIEDLREGDMVIARDEDSGQTGVFPVSAVMKGQSTDLRWLTLADAAGQTSRLGLTGGHPMFVVGAGWVQADEVIAGDRIRDSGLQELTVLSVEADTRAQIVHNLEIAGAHTYFAGELEAWGHNTWLHPTPSEAYENSGGTCGCGCGQSVSPSTTKNRSGATREHRIPQAAMKTLGIPKSIRDLRGVVNPKAFRRDCNAKGSARGRRWNKAAKAIRKFFGR